VAKRVFISYAYEDQPQARAQALALRRAGIRSWRDEDELILGKPSEAEIRQAIRDECDGALLWLSPSTLSSSFVMDIELPIILTRASEGGFPVVPVFQGLSPSEAATRVRERTGLEVAAYNGQRIAATDDLASVTRTIASRFVVARMGASGDRVSEPRPVIRAVTRDDTAGGIDEACLDFDWRHAYLDGAAPDPMLQLELAAALGSSISALLAAYGGGEIILEARVHLSVALALGFALRRPTGAVPAVRYDDGVWLAAVGSDAEGLEERLDWGPVEAEQLAVELPISRDVSVGVDQLVTRAGPFRARLRFNPTGGPGQAVVRDVAQANAWADQVIERAAAVRDEARASSIGLFVAAPLPLAVFLGWRLNAAGRVISYEWKSNMGPYVPGWSLP
jgi:hypothetical protein